MNEVMLDSIISKISNDLELVFPFHSNESETYAKSLERRFKKLKDLLKNEYELHSSGGEILDKIYKTCDQINDAVAAYLHGNSGYAYKKIEEIFIESEMVKGQLEHFISDLDSCQRLYRVRLSNAELKDKADMFHIPYNRRYLVKNQRYSIAGLPCLYLGSSIFVCWEEMNRPDFSKMHISRFSVQKNSNFLNLAYAFRPLVKVNNTTVIDDDSYNLKLAKLIFYPILMACTFKKKYEDAHFVEEYIIPSLLLQWISSEKSGIDGIAYLSNKTYQGIEHPYGINFVFPPKDFTSNDNFCNKLIEKFQLTDPVSWQLLDSLKASVLTIPGTDIIDTKKDFISKYKDNTKFSDFELVLSKFPVSYLDFE